MHIKYYLDNKHFLAGITLKDHRALEANNLALHSCQNQEHVLYNREQLAYYLEQSLEQFVFASQTHSANIHKVTSQEAGKGTKTLDTAIPNTDALYTFEPNLVLTTMSADCVPILFYHAKAGVIGAIHSGWQGTVKEIVPKTFQHLIEKENCNPKDFYVFLGPSISQAKFEVDADVYQQFDALGYTSPHILYNQETGKYHIDNQRVIQTQCEKMGIPSPHIRIDPMCTYQHIDGFSYRENKQAGRHVSFIMRKPVL